MKTKEIIHDIVDLKNLVAYGDLTGKVSYKSSRGNQYILVAYHYNSNKIHDVAIKYHEAATIMDAYTQMNDYYAQAGVKPRTWILGNEFSGNLRNAFKNSTISYQLLPPKTHCSNVAVRAIQMYKNHFKAGLALLNPEFSIKE